MIKVLVSTALVFSAAAASAAEPTVRQATVAATVASNAAPAATAQPNKSRICMKMELTGTRMPKTVCRTHAEWLRQGVDPLASVK